MSILSNKSLHDCCFELVNNHCLIKTKYIDKICLADDIYGILGKILHKSCTFEQFREELKKEQSNIENILLQISPLYINYDRFSESDFKRDVSDCVLRHCRPLFEKK